ncbi:uncharacterized protein LOC114535312 [Dendronephthya gigantea]|uniref:uncharacterized protein LOC114535312 n=1 Tax=Dendronephthya gigantea TaxID=151771 RepID=UPI001068E68B|nr:uncharacterized protein LOC114535312 [Dendronephthya gigantea]
MNINYKFTKHFPSLKVFIGWIVIFFAVSAEDILKSGAKSIASHPRTSVFDWDSLEKPHTYASKHKKISHRKIERKKLLRQFVLGQFDPYTKDTSNDEKSSSNKHFVKKYKDLARTLKVAATKKGIYRNKTDDQIEETLAKKVRQLKSSKVITKTTHEKNVYRIRNLSNIKERSTRILKHNIRKKLRKKVFNTIGNVKDNQIRFEGDKTALSVYKETGFPFWLDGNFAFQYNPLDNFDGIYDKPYNYFLPEKNDYDENADVDGIWDGNGKKVVSKDYHRHDPETSLLTNWKTTPNQGKKIRVTDVFTTKHHKRKQKNNLKRPVRGNIKSGYIETKSRYDKLASEFRKKHHLLEKLHRKIKVENKNSFPEVFTEDTNERSKSERHKTKEEHSLLHKILNISVRSIVEFFHKYIFGNADPGKMALKDVLQVSNGGLTENFMHQDKNERHIDQKTSTSNRKISRKVILKHHGHQSKTPRILNATKRKDVNAVTRTVSPKMPKNTSKGNYSFIELIDVLIDDRLMDKNRYSSGLFYKKSSLPNRKDFYHSFKKIAKPRKSPYFIPLSSNAQILANSEKMNKYAVDNDTNVKRSDIYFPVQYTARKNDFRSFSSLMNVQNSRPFTQSFDISSLGEDLQQNNKQKKNYQDPFFSNDIPSSFRNPWYNADQKIIPSRQSANLKRNEDTIYSYFNRRKKIQEKYYKNYLALQETAHKPPPFTFHIYQGPRGDRMKITEQGNERHIENRGGIFGNNDKDIQISCKDRGKQDFVNICPHGWIRFRQFCFFLGEERHSWPDVHDLCSRKNGKMAMPKSQEVIAFLIDKLTSKKQYTRPYFVGIRKIDEEWQWIDDTPLSHGLSSQEKSHSHSCAAITEGSLRKMPCDFEAGYICEIKTGIEALRVLTFGDSLTLGYFNSGKSFHPYGDKLEENLNKDDHRCFVLEISGKNGEESDHMLQRLSNYLNIRQETYNWVLILAGTNDLLVGDSSSDRIADQIVIMHEVAHARGAKSLVITIPEIFCERTNCPHLKQRRKSVNRRLRKYAAAAGSKAYLSDLALKLSLHQLSLEDRKAFWEPSGVHLKAKGYDKMADIIFKDLMESIESAVW